MSGGPTSSFNQLIYENENFFETNNDNLIEIKNIFESRLFWERINTFFDIVVHKEEIDSLNKLYKLSPQKLQSICRELSSLLQQNPKETSFKISKPIKELI